MEHDGVPDDSAYRPASGGGMGGEGGGPKRGFLPAIGCPEEREAHLLQQCLAVLQVLLALLQQAILGLQGHGGLGLRGVQLGHQEARGGQDGPGLLGREGGRLRRRGPEGRAQHRPPTPPLGPQPHVPYPLTRRVLHRGTGNSDEVGGCTGTSDVPQSTSGGYFKPHCALGGQAVSWVMGR